LPNIAINGQAGFFPVGQIGIGSLVGSVGVLNANLNGVYLNGNGLQA